MIRILTGILFVIFTMSPAASSTDLKLEHLMKSTTVSAENMEIIVNRLNIPPNTTLPKHWHHGEEFAYILEGEVVLWQEGKEEQVLGTGELVKIPVKQIHTAITRQLGAKILIFRTHVKGLPERVLAEEASTLRTEN